MAREVGNGGKTRQNSRGRGGQARSQQDAGSGSGVGKDDNRWCFWRNGKGHIRPNCTTKEEDVIPRCDNCCGFGHTKDNCTWKGEACMAFTMESSVLEQLSDEEKFAVEAAAF